MKPLTGRIHRFSSWLDSFADRTSSQAEYERAREKTLLWMAMNGIR
ncbi:hypothetical protein [Spelaeicoccus albus]|uniref:Uncharacterized protein n=1 Tax=Spelaeicoccus albus TaxID=1280376 RepID=A0A7Z0IHP2_9MICO|nr:hypothetical protein [Spelaeicoccus albus]NYI67878.1 hypothetical protein [Spelaeicoccus albus]